MTAAPDIPADVMAAAGELVNATIRNYERNVFANVSQEAIARAILAERRRAAEICRNQAPATQDMTSQLIGDALCDAAAAIEAGAST